jgi:hypothetical protein
MRTRVIIVLLICVGVALGWVAAQFGLTMNSGLQQSGTAFSVGEHSVVTTYGYFGNGDKLAFAIIQTWPADTSPEEKLADHRVDFNSGGTPFILHSDGKYYPPDMSGTVYMFFGDELRTMTVQMDEHTDTVGLMRAKNINGVWSHLEQYKTQQE